MSKLEEFLAGSRPDEVAIFLSDAYLDDQTGADLADHGESVEGGVVIVVPGAQGRRAFEAGTGLDPMDFAGAAMDNEGRIDSNFAGGECPSAERDGTDEDHAVRFAFAFAEERNDEVGGIYAEGDVVHAYARCSCGDAYSDRWVAGER